MIQWHNEFVEALWTEKIGRSSINTNVRMQLQNHTRRGEQPQFPAKQAGDQLKEVNVDYMLRVGNVK